jgi:excisionase family DNA binding protein
MSQFLTPEELAERLHVKKVTVLRWARRRVIPVIRLSPRKVLFDLIEVEKRLRKMGEPG